jgi:hypothetical protein
LAGLTGIVDLARAIEKVEGDPDRFFEQERRCIVEPG